jgi:putative solute:sodium symporter small subunit
MEPDAGVFREMTQDKREAYWRANLRSIAGVLAIWAAASFGAGILFADRLDALRLFGFPLGFWFATQGAMLVFVGLVFVYVRWMNALDRRFGVYEE